MRKRKQICIENTIWSMAGKWVMLTWVTHQTSNLAEIDNKLWGNLLSSTGISDLMFQE